MHDLTDGLMLGQSRDSSCSGSYKMGMCMRVGSVQVGPLDMRGAHICIYMSTLMPKDLQLMKRLLSDFGLNLFEASC